MRTPEEIKEYHKIWYQKNKEKVALYKREHYNFNIEKYKIRATRFNKSQKRKDWKEKTKEYRSNYSKEYWNKIKSSKPHLKREYGITLEDYNQLLINQDYKCLGCGILNTDVNRGLCVDHYHSTGKIRGLLCTKCNSALGYVNDNLDILNNLIKYLSHDKSESTD